MGKVIDLFPKKEKEIAIEIDGQLYLEISIVRLWERSKGMDLIMSVPEYHILFLQFSNLCFDLMTNKEIVVSKDGEIELTDTATKQLIEFVEEKG